MNQVGQVDRLDRWTEGQVSQVDRKARGQVNQVSRWAGGQMDRWAGWTGGQVNQMDQVRGGRVGQVGRSCRGESEMLAVFSSVEQLSDMELSAGISRILNSRTAETSSMVERLCNMHKALVPFLYSLTRHGGADF